MPKQESFFKCMSIDVAFIVLENFNDPFDYNPALTTVGVSKFLKRVSENKNLKIHKKKPYKILSFLLLKNLDVKLHIIFP